MKGIKRLLCLSVSLLLWCSIAEAKDPETLVLKNTLAKQEALIKKISEGHIQIIKTFAVSDEFQGFVVKTPADKEVILYVNQKADTLFMGTMVNQDGTDLTAQYTQQYIHAEIAQQAYIAVEKTQWFQEGKDSAPHKLYVIVDPLCGFCKKQYALLKPLIEQGDVQVRWVMVGYLRAESPGIAVNILMGKTDQEKIERLAQQEQSGLQPVKPDDSVFLTSGFFATVSKNTAFFEKFSSYFIGTPTFLYINDAHQPQFHPGMIVQERMSSVLSHVSKDWAL